MIDNEIIKALECCTTETCWDCPFEPKEQRKGTFGCCEENIKNALDLINRQQAENRKLQLEKEMLEIRLKSAINSLNKSANSALKVINRQQADTERLKKLLAEGEAKYNECAKRFYKAGIKDFAHTFVERFIIILNLNYEQANVARQCEEFLVKEMVGDTE